MGLRRGVAIVIATAAVIAVGWMAWDGFAGGYAVSPAAFAPPLEREQTPADARLEASQPDIAAGTLRILAERDDAIYFVGLSRTDDLSFGVSSRDGNRSATVSGPARSGDEVIALEPEWLPDRERAYLLGPDVDVDDWLAQREPGQEPLLREGSFVLLGPPPG